MPANYSGQNLRGRSFKGQSLEGADFSGADIRGADFTGANLKEANFENAKAGLETQWTIVLAIFLFLVTIILVAICFYTVTEIIGYLFIGLSPETIYKASTSTPRNMSAQELASVSTLYQVMGVGGSFLKLSLLIGLLIITLRKNLTTILRAILTVFVVSGLLGCLLGGFLGLLLGISMKLGFIEILLITSFWSLFGGFLVTFIVAFVGAVTLVLGITVILSLSLSIATSIAISGNLFRLIVEIVTVLCNVVVLSIAIIYLVYVIPTQIETSQISNLAKFLLSCLFILINGALILVGCYIGRQAAFGNQKYTSIWKVAVAFAAAKGTNFQKANLTDASFRKALIRNTNFKNSTLKRTNFLAAKRIECAFFELTYLESQDLQQLVSLGFGQDKNFDYRKDLRYINLQGADLKDASFISTDLSEANLQDTDLSRAKLVQAQFNSTDFTGATLTGAYAEDWNITSQTNFTGVRCQYIYMHLPTKENPDPLRKPDNRDEMFADGEFGDFIKPIVDTLDLYHNSDVDPRAIAISFKKLAETHPDAELRIVGMEVKGEDKLLLRAETATNINKSELSAEYFDTYNYIKALPEREVKLLLAEKDSRIRSLETMVTTALERPNFYSHTQVGQVSTMTNNPGGFSVGGSVGGNLNNVQGDNNRAIQGDGNQGVLGDNNQVSQANQAEANTNTSLTKEEVIKLLAQLETLVKGADIPAETKEEVAEDLSSAKKATDKEEPNKNRALDRLGSVAETLEKTSKTVESGQKIWTTAKPIIVKIATWLGAAAGSHLLGL